MSGTYSVEMGDRGRLVVPAGLRRDLGWETGMTLHLIETDTGVIMMTREQLKRYVRSGWQAAGTDVLDELFAERRAAAAADLHEGTPSA